MRTTLFLALFLLNIIAQASTDQTIGTKSPSENKSTRKTNRNKINYCKNFFTSEDDLAKERIAGGELVAPSFTYIQEEFDYHKLNKIMPLDLKPTNEATKVFNKIADKSINTILTSESFKSSSVGIMSENIKEKTKTEIKFSSDLAPTVQHQMTAELQPFQGQTKLSYQGFFDADLIFKNNINDFEFKIKEKLFNKNVFYQNQLSKNVHSNELGISWDW